MSEPQGAVAPSPPAARAKLRISRVVLLAVLGGLAFVAASTTIGPVALPPLTTLEIFFHQLTGGLLPWGGCSSTGGYPPCSWTEIIWGARVPSIVMALVAGAALGLSGAGLQGVFRNPLADPFLLGLSSGAALGAASIFVFDINPAHQAATLPLAAFLGGIVPGTVIYLSAAWGRRSAETLILTGVALSTFFSAILSALLLYNPNSDVSLNFWLLGSLEAISWPDAALAAGVVLALGTGLVLSGREINLLQLGPEVAQSLGVRPQRVVQTTVLLSTAMTATVVAFSGIIGFIGLIAPHIVRRLAGVDYRVVLPLSALFGGLVLLLAWDLAEGIIPPVVIPVGIPTAFIGAPFLIYLLYRRRSTEASTGAAA